MDRVAAGEDAETVPLAGAAAAALASVTALPLDGTTDDRLAAELETLCRERVYDLSAPVAYFPVRHHSPACSHHLLRAMRDYRPEIVLIEGPEGADELIPVLADEATEPPVSLYCTYESEDEKAAWYYPLLSCSPEYAALKEAAAQGVPCRFIDLDYRPRQAAELEEASTSLQDETLLGSSEFIAELCRRMRCRSFDELWERVFEIGGLSADTASFVRDVFTYCTLSRMCYPETRLRREGELDREANMRRHIREAREQYARVLVVTGGFHTYGLLDPEPAGAWPSLSAGGGAGAGSSEMGESVDLPGSGDQAVNPPLGETIGMTDSGGETVGPASGKAVGLPGNGDGAVDLPAGETVGSPADRAFDPSGSDGQDAGPPPGESGDLAGSDAGAFDPSADSPDPQLRRVGKRQHYPMIYTFQEADRLNGYASGMPYVSYYDAIWSQLQQGRRAPYPRAALRLLARLARALREGGDTVSTSDAIEAYSLLQGLAALRDKREGGVYELMDAVLAAFVKGEHTVATDAPLRRLQALLTGDKIGRVAESGYTVPIVEDVKRRAAAARLELRTTGKRQRTLELYSKPGHRQVSRLLHAISYLVPEFASRESGPDWVSGRHMNRVRETWSYGYSALIEARLIEQSLYGGTLQEAATRRLEEAAAELPDHHSGELAALLVQALLMGLQETSERLFGSVRAALRQDGHFLSLCQTLHALHRLQQHGGLLGLEPDERLPALLREACARAVDHLPGIARTAEDMHDEIIQGLKLLAMLASSLSDDGWAEQLGALLDDRDLPPRLEGVCVSLAVAEGSRSRTELVSRARGYIRGTPDQVRHTAPYLQGLFTAGRDVFLYDDDLLAEVNVLVGELPHETFIEMVADLRLAFTYFTSREKTLIAGRLAGHMQVAESELERPALDERELVRARVLDEAIRKEAAAWNLI